MYPKAHYLKLDKLKQEKLRTACWRVYGIAAWRQWGNRSNIKYMVWPMRDDLDPFCSQGDETLEICCRWVKCIIYVLAWLGCFRFTYHNTFRRPKLKLSFVALLYISQTMARFTIQTTNLIMFYLWATVRSQPGERCIGGSESHSFHFQNNVPRWIRSYELCWCGLLLRLVATQNLSR